MTQVFRYISFDGTSWSVSLGSTAVRLGRVPGFTELALLGAVGTSSLVVEDTTGTAGHASDGFLPLQMFAVDETTATPQRLYAGWTGLIEDVAGPEGPTDSLRTGVQNRINISLDDANTLAGRRALKPKASDSSVSRPAETAAVRIAWLLGTAYFSGVADNGLVHPAGSPTLTANDFSSAHPADVLNDCCTATGDNWFVYWDRTAAAWSLAVFNFTTYAGYTASLALSNDPAVYDSSTAGAGVNNVWVIEPGARLTKDPGTLATEVQYTYAKGVVDVVGSSATYPVVTQIASSTTVKTSALATTKATRYLSDNAAPQHRITCDAKILAAHVNDALPGQLVVASFRQWPQYASPSFFRITGMTKAQLEETDQFYAVNFQLAPATPAALVVSYAEIEYPEAPDPTGTAGPALLNWSNTGDSPKSPRTPHPLVGLMAYDATGVSGSFPSDKTGIKMLGSGTVTIHCEAGFEFAYTSGPGKNVTLTVYNSGVSIGSATKVDVGTGIHAVSGYLDVDLTGVTVATNDIITAKLSWVSAPAIGSIPIAGTSGTSYLSVSGTLS